MTSSETCIYERLQGDKLTLKFETDKWKWINICEFLSLQEARVYH